MEIRNISNNVQRDELYYHIGSSDLYYLRFIDENFSESVLSIKNYDKSSSVIDFIEFIDNSIQVNDVLFYSSADGSQISQCFCVKELLNNKSILTTRLDVRESTGIQIFNKCKGTYRKEREIGKVFKPRPICFSKLLGAVTPNSVESMYQGRKAVTTRTGDNKVIIRLEDCSYCGNGNLVYSVGQRVNFENETGDFTIIKINESSNHHIVITFDKEFMGSGCRDYMMIVTDPVLYLDIVCQNDEIDLWSDEPLPDCSCGEVIVTVPEKGKCLIPTELGANYRFDIFEIRGKRKTKIIEGDFIVYPSVSYPGENECC